MKGIFDSFTKGINDLLKAAVFALLLTAGFFTLRSCGGCNKSLNEQTKYIILPPAPAIGDTLEYISDSTKAQSNENIKAIIIHIGNSDVDSLYRNLQRKHEPRFNQGKNRFDSLQD